jgi:hypothetical protein
LLHVRDIAGRREAPAEDCGSDADGDALEKRRHAEDRPFHVDAGLALAIFNRVRKHRPEDEVQPDDHHL